jgi:VIT1/CCC1 family predicted Fe2+/Mn2+ transporter
MNKEMWKSKTFWTGIVSIVGAIGGVVTGTLPVAMAIQTGVTALLAIFIRDGIASK